MPLKAAVGLGDTMVVCAVVSLVGLLVTFLFVEDRRGKGMEGEGEAEAKPTVTPNASLLHNAHEAQGP